MIDDIFVFDCVIHLHDMSNENLNPSRPDSTYVRDMQVGMGEMLRQVHGGDLDYATRTSVEDMHRLVFEESPTDMALRGNLQDKYFLVPTLTDPFLVFYNKVAERS